MSKNMCNVLVPLNKERLEKNGWREAYAYSYSEKEAMLIYAKTTFSENNFMIMGHDTCRSAHIAKALYELIQFKKAPILLLMDECPLTLDSDFSIQTIFDKVFKFEKQHMNESSCKVLQTLPKEKLERDGLREAYAYRYNDKGGIIWLYARNSFPEKSFKIMHYNICQSIYIARALYNLLQIKQEPIQVLLGKYPLSLHPDWSLELILDFVVQMEKVQL